MPAEDAMRCGQPNAYARKLLFRVHALEGTKEFTGVAHIEARPVVAHEVGRRGCRLRADLDASGSASARELPSVLQQRIERGSQERGIAFSGEAVGNYYLNHARGLCCLQTPQNAACGRRKIDAYRMKLGAVNPRERQQPLEHARHALGGIEHMLQVAATVRIQLLAAILAQRTREPVDGSQRRTQIMSDGIGQRFELAAGLLQGRKSLFRVRLFIRQSASLPLRSGWQW